MQQLLRRVVAHLLLTAVHCGDLHDNCGISAGLDGDRHRRDLDAENIRILLINAHAVIDLGGIPRLQLNNHVDLLLELDGAHAEQSADIDDADTAQLKEVTDILRRCADEIRIGDFAQLNCVIRDQTVSALDQLDRAFGFADAALARDEDALAVNLDQHAVARDTRREMQIEE